MNLDPADEALQRSAEYAELGLYDEAQALVRQALVVDPGHVELLERMAYLYLAQGNGEEAMALAEQIREAHPEMGAPYHIEVQVLQLKGRIEDALALCNEILAENPTELPFLERKAISLAYLQRPEEALEAIDQYHALSEEPDRTLLQTRAQLLHNLDRKPESLKAAHELVDLYPLEADAHALLGQLLAYDNRPDEARKALKKALQLQPGHTDAHEALVSLIASRNPVYRFLAALGPIRQVNLWYIIPFLILFLTSYYREEILAAWIYLPVVTALGLTLIGHWYIHGFMLFTLLLDPYGRYTLTRFGKSMALVMPAAAILCLLQIIASSTTHHPLRWLAGAGATSIAIIPAYYSVMMNNLHYGWQTFLALLSVGSLVGFYSFWALDKPLDSIYLWLTISAGSSFIFLRAQALVLQEADQPQRD